MAPIQEIDRRRMEYACSSCNVSLPFNLVNTIMADRDKVTQCEGCLRILYATEDLRSELVKK
jgi:predicted  nucleic acid-binding Zn-ribbon protein